MIWQMIAGLVYLFLVAAFGFYVINRDDDKDKEKKAN